MATIRAQLIDGKVDRMCIDKTVGLSCQVKDLTLLVSKECCQQIF